MRAIAPLRCRYAFGDRDLVIGPCAASPGADTEFYRELRDFHQEAVRVYGDPADHLIQDRIAALQLPLQQGADRGIAVCAALQLFLPLFQRLQLSLETGVQIPPTAWSRRLSS